MKTFFEHPVTWLFVSFVLIVACTYLPLWIKDDRLRSWVMRWILVPVSIIIIAYLYPTGIEIFKKIALAW